MLLEGSASEIVGGTKEGKEEARKATRFAAEDVEVDMEQKMEEKAKFWGEIARGSKTRGFQYRSWREQALSSASFTGSLRTINAPVGSRVGEWNKC